MIKYLVWKIATSDLQKRWRTGDLHVSEALFPGLESMEVYRAGPTWESARVLPSFTMTYEDGHEGTVAGDESRRRKPIQETYRGQLLLGADTSQA
jgi:hypothetical protein